MSSAAQPAPTATSNTTNATKHAEMFFTADPPWNGLLAGMIPHQHALVVAREGPGEGPQRGCQRFGQAERKQAHGHAGVTQPLASEEVEEVPGGERPVVREAVPVRFPGGPADP